jgi:hypothetical protein
MAEQESTNSSSSVFSLNTLLAVVSVVGGIILVSHKLASDRPKPGSQQGTRPLGLQNIESRLWEDPFAAWDKLTDDQRAGRRSNGLSVLAHALTNDLKGTNLLLGVMVSGQPYAEDKESRIRARYAVGAALGANGFKPATADHIGLAACPWPGSVEFQTNAGYLLAGNLATWLPDETNLVLRVPFEQYEKRQFFAQGEYATNSFIPNRYERVLLLWLDEEYFDDDPASRLALLFSQFGDCLTNRTLDQALIGPHASDTLRSLLASQASGGGSWYQVTQTLSSVRLILATPSAMDEVLVRTNEASDADFARPRQAAAKALQLQGLFRSVTNFACTDKQLAEEALCELKLRDIDPANNPSQHLVLISEWDTFHSRVSGLALASAMSVRHGGHTNAWSFITQLKDGVSNIWPQTLHRFVYLQGLDGESADSDTRQQQDENKKEGNSQKRPTSLEELAQWKPEANKAEGSAQFDYLVRLGDVLEAMNRDLWRGQRAQVAAIGIIGSDVYDTLLILQALRQRLPDAVFFTTDLDARFWAPDELAWSRNLIVLSGYGLRLKNELQSGVPPFRDSAQAAQFMATLNALRDPRAQNLDQIPPRRFEIGRGGPVDLSVANGVLLHPGTRSPLGKLWQPLALAVGILAAALFFGWKPLRQLGFPSRDYQCEPLAITADDLGEISGLRSVLKRLQQLRAEEHQVAHWLLERLAEPLEVQDFRDLPAFVTRLKSGWNPTVTVLVKKFSEATRSELEQHSTHTPVPGPLQEALVKDLNRLINDSDCLFKADTLPDAEISPATAALRRGPIPKDELPHLNRLLLEELFAEELGQRTEAERHKRLLERLIASCNALIFMPKEGPLLPEDVRACEAFTKSRQRVADGHKLRPRHVFANRVAVNDLLRTADEDSGKPNHPALWARRIALLTYKNRRARAWLFWLAAALLSGGGLLILRLAWRDTYVLRTGEPFNLTGVSAWPAEFLRFGVLALSLVVILKAQRRLSQCILDVTRRYRLSLDVQPDQGKGAPGVKFRPWNLFAPEPPALEAVVDANDLWREYRRTRHVIARLLRVAIFSVVYIGFMWALFKLAPPPINPIRGDTLVRLNAPLLICSAIAFLVVTFWMIDAAQCCAWFINRLSQAPTRYPEAALTHFKRQRSVEDGALVEEWIDLHIIADLTEPVGRLVHWPFLAVLLMLAARNSWLDHWTWHWPLLAMFALNLTLAAASSLILQRAASQARDVSVKRLKEKLHQKERQAAGSVVEHESSQAARLLEEITMLRRGAFTPFSKSPLVGALLANSSGLVLLELLATLFSK